MNNRYMDDWDRVYDRFETWWAREPMDGPLLFVTAPRDRPLEDLPEPVPPGAGRRWLDADYLASAARHRLAVTYLGGDAFPYMDANYGPGSLALYLGSDPVFDDHTVWYKPCIEDLGTTPLPEFDPLSRWFKSHLELVGRLREDAGEDCYVAIPDLVESLDILAAMRDPQTLLYDIVDRPAEVHRWLQRINDLYMPHYDAFYDTCKDDRDRSVFTAFRIIGNGKVCKVQCDYAAMLSPDLFAEFFVPYLATQVRRLDHTLFHLDGPDAVCHLDHLLDIEELNAIQWVPGAGNTPAGDEHWFPMYRKILDAGKGLQITVAAAHVEPVLRAIGGQGVHLLTGTETEREARELTALSKRLAPAP